MPTQTPTQSHPKSAPWYKNYMITVFVIGLPAVVVIACIFFVFYAVKVKDATVRDDWYMDSKALYQDASKDQKAYDLGVHGVLRFDGGQVRFEMNYPTDSISSGQLKDGSKLTYPKTLALTISHATDKNKDHDVILTHVKDNVYQGEVNLDPLPSKYYLHINNDEQGWRLTQSQKLPASNVALMPLSSFSETNQTLPDQRHKRHLQNNEQ